MSSILPDPDESKWVDSLCMLIVWVIALFVLFFTLPGCKSDDQKQKYQPYVAPPAPAVDKIRPAVQEAATRVDDVLEKTPVPAVAEVLADDVLDTIEQVEAIPNKLTAPDPQAAEIIEPTPDPLFEEPDVEQPFDEVTVEESSGSLSTWLVVIAGLGALLYICVKALKGTKDVEDTDGEETTS